MAQTKYTKEYNFAPHRKGDTWYGAEITVTNVNDEAVDLTDFTIKMHLRRTKKDATPTLSFSTETGGITITDAINGKFQINEQIIDIPAKIYLHDIEFTSPEGIKRTWIKGEFQIIQDVTYE